MSNTQCCDFNVFLKAMADEMRQLILTLLQSGEISVNELAERLTVTQPTISHHLALLRRASLVSARREGKRIFYRANSTCVAECCGEMQNRFFPVDTVPSLDKLAGRIKILP